MVTIVTRAGKGSPLTHNEVDANFTNLNTGKAELASPAFTGQASFADGSAAAPSIAHTGDLNAGLFFPAADTIAFTKGGVEAMRIDSSGNVGIGTTSPASKFEIAATVPDIRLTAGSTLITNFYASATGTTINTVPAQPLYFGTNNTERMRIDASGNVGIGTSSPASKLDVNGIVRDVAGDLRDLVNSSKTAAYVPAATDNGKLINITTGGITINASVFTAGQNVTIYNNSGSSQTITQGTSVTMYLAGTATTGNRTLAQRGICTILCVASNTFVCSGAGVT